MAKEKTVDVLAVGAGDAAKGDDILSRKVVEDHVDDVRVGERIETGMLVEELAVATGFGTCSWCHGEKVGGGGGWLDDDG